MTDNTTATGPAPAGYHRLNVFFAAPGCAKAIDFYQQALGAEVVKRMDTPDGQVMHAELRLGETMFQLSEPMPEYGILPSPAEGNAFTMTYWTTDVDEVFAKAVELGATPINPVADSFSGDRMGVFRCPAGIRWCIARHDRDVPDEEIAAAALEWTNSES
ncbi:VOC family protein [Crossiella sp. SN42]|uniref:VOC family protein n=1 Tax=Crossiella sp. SN42 TaxID=2944808 RepID=UPI00207D6336|nr:VOC family protein [Crossiella sp. SN42]MCO1579775.1 VOC family protein [Crossiella sp. SN42]